MFIESSAFAGKVFLEPQQEVYIGHLADHRRQYAYFH